jgi:hypothetical protein
MARLYRAVVAQGVSEAALLAEVTLQVDHQQRHLAFRPPEWPGRRPHV